MRSIKMSLKCQNHRSQTWSSLKGDPQRLIPSNNIKLEVTKEPLRVPEA